MSTPTPGIDRAKLRDAIRRMDDEYVFFMLYEAIDLLPEAELAALAARFVRMESLLPESGQDRSLLEEVRSFDADARRGGYYVSFSVNSKNCTDLSKGTRTFIAETCRLLGRCVAEAEAGDLAVVNSAMSVIFALLRSVDEGDDDIVFFADEGGLWLFGIDWPAVMGAWFKCLSQSFDPAEYARRVIGTIEEFDRARRAEHIEAALRLATAPQREALERLASG
jgi:hypothetical protein